MKISKLHIKPHLLTLLVLLLMFFLALGSGDSGDSKKDKNKSSGAQTALVFNPEPPISADVKITAAKLVSDFKYNYNNTYNLYHRKWLQVTGSVVEYDIRPDHYASVSLHGLYGDGVGVDFSTKGGFKFINEVAGANISLRKTITVIGQCLFDGLHPTLSFCRLVTKNK